MAITDFGARLKIEASDAKGYVAKVWLNDLEISSFTSRLSLVIDAKEANHVTLDLWVDHLEVDANVLAQIQADVGKIETTPCTECGKVISDPLSAIELEGQLFCTKSCAREWSLGGLWSQ